MLNIKFGKSCGFWCPCIMFWIACCEVSASLVSVRTSLVDAGICHLEETMAIATYHLSRCQTSLNVIEWLDPL